MYTVHVLGAALTFGIGTFYLLIQTILSYMMQPDIHGKEIFWIRLTLLLWCVSSLLSSILCCEI